MFSIKEYSIEKFERKIKKWAPWELPLGPCASNKV
jgi:hypothetical protein